ncbi:MAG: hypothetical protein D6712_20530 [Chloroflexi bacterium]|nr:MAG: hypothetical protein D6712_20530 [Chloroflexota bacterium]
MAKFTVNKDGVPVHIDLSPVERGERIGFRSLAEEEEKRAEDAAKGDAALNNALQLVYETAIRLGQMAKALDGDGPAQMLVEFGVAMREDESAMITKFTGDAHFRVKMTFGEID